MEDAVERRRAPRVRVAHHEIALVTRDRVRVLDIGLGGVLIAALSEGLPLGAATLRVPLPAGLFVASVRFRHATRWGREIHAGAAFLDMGSDNRLQLEQFLAKTDR